MSKAPNNSSKVTPASLAQVRGTAFLGIIKHVRENGSELDAIVAGSAEITREVLAERVRVLGWYPYDAFAGLLRSVDRQLGGGDLAYCRYLGEQASKEDLSTVFTFLAKLCSPERLIRSCGRVWKQYYRNAGRMEAVAWDPENTVLRIYGFSRMDAAHCQLMAGWMTQSMGIIGATVHDSEETRCTSRGDAYHEFRCGWSI